MPGGQPAAPLYAGGRTSCASVAPGAMVCRRVGLISRQGWRLAAEFSLVILGMLLFSERTWKHHCVTLLLPFAVIAYYLAACRPGALLRAYLIGSLAVVLLLMTSTGTSGVWDLLDEAAKRAQVYGAYVWANLVLVAALVVLLRRKEAALPIVRSRPTSETVSSVPPEAPASMTLAGVP